MRVGILTPTQASDTPYSQAPRFVSKSAAHALLRRALLEEIVKNKLYRELRPKTALTITIVPFVAERAFALPTVRSCYVKRELPIASGNQNLDLAYPEALRCTVIPKHPAMLRECQRVRAEKKARLVESEEQHGTP